MARRDRAPSRDQAHLVTDARQSRSADIAHRERRYLLMMGLRLACFLLAGLLIWLRAGWLAAIPAVGAIVLPYFAVVVANAGRRTDQETGFRPYEPSLPARYEPPPGSDRPGDLVRLEPSDGPAAAADPGPAEGDR